MRISNISFGKLHINKTDQNRFNLQVFSHHNELVPYMYDAFLKIDSATDDTPVVLNLYRAKIPLSNGKTKDGWQFIVSDKKTGEILSESSARREENYIGPYKSALNNLVNDLKADKFQCEIKTVDNLIDKFN